MHFVIIWANIWFFLFFVSALEVHISRNAHFAIFLSGGFIIGIVQYTLDLRKPDLRKNLNLRKIVATTDFLVHKLFDLRKIF